MRVMLAFDGSTAATDATALVGTIAWPADSVLRVVSVIEPMLLPTSGPYQGAGLAPGVDEAITAYTHETLQGVVERLRSPGRSVEGAVLRGRAANAIIDDATEFRADLLVVGSRGHGTVASLLLGSVSSEVADHAPCPVLVARTTDLTRVVFATDGSPSARAAELILSEWPVFEGLPIRVISVAEIVLWWAGLAPTMYGQELDAYSAELETAKAEHESIASAAAARLREHGRAADAEARGGDVAAEIVGVIERDHADLAVLGRTGRTGRSRILLGSVARNVLSGTTASVLIVRDGTAERQESERS